MNLFRNVIIINSKKFIGQSILLIHFSVINGYNEIELIDFKEEINISFNLNCLTVTTLVTVCSFLDLSTGSIVKERLRNKKEQ